MDPVEIPVDSDALRANISRTAQAVVISERYLPLVKAVEGYHGVAGPLLETLSEYFHIYRNVDLLVDGFQTILLRNWTYFERSETAHRGLRPALRIGARPARHPAHVAAGVAAAAPAAHLVRFGAGRTSSRRVRRAAAERGRVSLPLHPAPAAGGLGARHPAAEPAEARRQTRRP